MLGGHKKYGTLVICLHQLQSMIDVLLTRQVTVFNWVTLGQTVWCMGLGAQKLGSTGVGKHGWFHRNMPPCGLPWCFVLTVCSIKDYG